ncbi:MAG TPA: hypothetical protein VM261_11805 [Kofleriaceae bacterium]|nr:hypothetical protein [Kofleriaceae bacterium]
MRTLRLPALFACSLVAAAGACTDSTEDEADVIVAALEQENGGLDTTDEAPAFGDAEAFAAAGIENSTAVPDTMDTDTEVVALRARTDVQRLRVAAVWGQLPPDRDADVRHDWSGRIEVSRGAIIVRNRIGFEEATDRLAPRDSRTAIAFESVTQPFADGLVLEVLADADLAGITLSYVPTTGARLDIRLADLVAGPVSTERDADGNRIIVTALRRDRDDCDHGFMRGRWHALREGVGAFRGIVTDEDGTPIGHMRGIYGHRRNGEQVYFGKYINREGQFRGIFAGHYRDGGFVGRWMTRAGEHGRLGGNYRESLPGPEAGGAFMGRWAETSCAADFPADRP